jgi:hypothetical protein
VHGVEWHVNFSDPEIFCAYGLGLLAQDEWQAAEHPILGSLRETLLEEGKSTLTIEKNQPTPILVRGVPRLGRIETKPDAQQGRPHGLYGNHFAQSDDECIKKAVTRIAPPTISNIIAMAALSGGFDTYERDEIEYHLGTAYTAFSAARHETLNLVNKQVQTVVHTGFWGCGAFGGNRELMALLQFIAAHLANIDILVFYAFDDTGIQLCSRAQSRFNKICTTDRKEISMDSLIDQITHMGYEWGMSDGN